MANEFVAKNGIIAKANSAITGTLDVSGNITMGTALVATRTWVTGTALSGYATESYVTTAIANLVDAAPGTLDTLNELAAALGDDPNFATTITNSIATKLPLAGGTMTGNINWTSTELGLVWTMNTDGAYIKFFNTGDGDTNSRLEYATSDNGDEYHRFLVAGIERMAITSSGISATGYNKSNWDTAYSWGNHASAGYLTSESDTLASVTARGNTTNGSITVQGGQGASETTDGYGLEIMGNYTNGQYNHRLAKFDKGGGVPLYVQFTSGTANVWSNSARFGSYSGNGYEFEVYGAAKINGDFASTGQINASGGNSSQWNTAYGWGNHASAGYLTSYTETDTLNSVISRNGTTTGTAVFTQTSNTLVNTVAAANRGLTVYQDTSGADAYMTFHISGDYAGYFGLGGAENDLVWGGWSVGNARHRIWHSGNDGSGSSLDSDLLDGFHASQSGGGNVVLTTASNGYLYVNNWIHPANGTGLFYDSGPHFYENGGQMYSSHTIRVNANILITDGADNNRFQKGSSFLNLRDPYDNVHLFNAGSGVYVDSNIHYWRSTSAEYWMTLSSTGLGIGVGSPSYKLDVAGAVRLTGSLVFDDLTSNLIQHRAGTDVNTLVTVGHGGFDHNGYLRIGGADVATQSWVQSQGYLTSETDSQTLSWEAGSKNLTISNGNTVTLDGLATEEYVTSQGYITGYTETDTLASVTGRGASTSSPITINGGGSQPLSLTTANGGPWHIALVRNDLGLTSRVFAHNSPYNGWFFEHNISIDGNTNWHSGNDGSGSGLDADLLDGIDSARFIYGQSGNRRGTNLISNWNQTDFPDVAFLSAENGGTNAPSSDYTYGTQYSFHRSGAAYRTQLVTALYSDTSIYVRNSRDSDVWTSWKRLWHSGDFSSTNVSNWNAAYNDKINSASFNTTDGVLTLTQQDGGTVTVDLDGRYLTSETDSQTLSWEAGSKNLSISNGNTVTLDGLATEEYVTSQGYLTSLPAHNHDDRYYTETESDARYLYYRGYSTSGDTQTFQSTPNTLRFDQVGDLSGAWSNEPTGYYTYGGILSLRGANFALQIYGSHTGDLAFKTQWENDQYSGWRTIITSANIGSQSVAYATSAGSATSASTATTVTGKSSISYVAHSAGANDYNLELYSDDTGDATKYVSLRFHQGSRYWGQIRYNNAGFRLTGGADDSLNNIYAGIYYATGGNSTNWNTAYGWGNHADAGYFKLDTQDPITIQSETVTFSGNVVIEGTLTESSSIRFKENIKPLEPALGKVEELNPVTYNKIGSEDEEIGLIAEEVAELFPEVVTYNENGEPSGIQYQRLSVILLKAVQELTERVNKLENK